MTIGTAVPEPAELAHATHHFIHNKSIFDEYSVGDFEQEALKTLDSLFTKNDFAIMVGGSGLYVDAVLKGFDKFPDVEDYVRIKIRAEYEQHGLTYLQDQLKEYDPDYYGTVDIDNPQRMTRALEVSISSGRPYSSFLNRHSVKRDFTPIIIGLDAERSILYSRINQRVDMMMMNGLEEEARKLYPHRELNALRTVGYRELFDYFDGKESLGKAIDEIKKNSRRFAKRQLTWFRRNESANWFDFQESTNLIINHIQKNSNL